MERKPKYEPISHKRRNSNGNNHFFKNLNPTNN